MSYRIILSIVALQLFLLSCSTLRDAADIREPNVEFSKMSIQSISFDGVSLLFDFDVTNPNRMDVTAEGYQYEFFINERSFLSGEQNVPVAVSSESTTKVQVPVSMNFAELYETFGSLIRGDSLSYKLATEVDFDLPVIGTRRVPVEANGVLPVPRVPRVSLGNFEIKKLSLSGAEFEVTFRISNPNLFALALHGAEYVLRVNGREWLDTELIEAVQVAGSETREFTFPVILSTAQLGSAMIDIIAGRTQFNYELTGRAQVSADLEGFEDGQEIPFDLKGVYNLE